MTSRLTGALAALVSACAIAPSSALAAGDIHGTITIFGGDVYSAPWTVRAQPHPIATLDTGTPVTVVCRTPAPDETPDQATAHLNWFFRITWASGRGYVQQPSVKITTGGESFTVESIPSC